MHTTPRILLAAQGYSELGMVAEALGELDSLPAAVGDQPETLEIRLTVLMRAKRWPEALAVSRRICEIASEEPGGYIHAAFCLHELSETETARALLLSGPASLIEEPTYHYNLACYECRLGNLEAARAYLETSIQMDKKYGQYARTDPDLAPLRSKS